MSAEPKPGSVAEIVERAKQEIKDLLAVNSGDYTPTEAEKLNIDLMLRAEVTRAVEEAMKQAIEEFTRYHHNPIVTDKNKELQQLREQLEGYRGYVSRIEGSNKTGSGSQLQIVSHQLGLAEKENYELRQQLRQASKHDKALIDAAEQEIQLLRERLKQSQEISDRLERIIDERES